MAQEEYVTKLRMTADLSGGIATEKEYDRVLAKAKELGKKNVEEAKKTKDSFAALSKTVGAFRRVLMGFGVAGLFAGIITSIKKVSESFAEAKKQADEMAKIQKQLDESKHIQNLAAQYDQLKDSAEKAAAAQNAALEQIDTDVSNRRRLDKAKMNAAKQEELAALDPNDEYYAEKVQQIEAKYSGMSANMEASNAREDIVLERQKLDAQAEQKDQAATAQDAQSASIRAQIAQAKRRQSAAQIASVDLNEADKNGFWDSFGTNIKNILTLNWGRVAGAQTEEGDRIRREKAKEAADAELKVAELEEKLRQSEDRAAALRRESGNIRTKRDSLGVALDAADIEVETARRQGDIGIEKADTAMQKKREQVAKDSWAEGQKEADRLAQETDAARAKALLEAEKARIEQQIAAQQQRKFDAGAAVFTAQGALNNAQANRDRAGAASAAQQLSSAQAAATNIEFSADALIKKLTEKLKSVNSLLNKATSAIEKNNSQRLAAQAEALTTN